jgi:hypothetical protein
MVDPTDDRPSGPPRLPESRRPCIPKDGAISVDEDGMPDDIDYDPDNNRLVFRDEHGNAAGAVDQVTPEIWNYRVSSDTPLIRQWFSYRKKDRSRPLIGDRRPPSDLNRIQTQSWLPEYTTELLSLLNILGLLIDLEPAQASLLDKILGGPLLTHEELANSGALDDSADVTDHGSGLVFSC